MIAEPYIRIKGPAAGEICTIDWRCETEEFLEQKDVGGVTYVFQRYADFEQARLKKLGCSFIGWHVPDGFTLITNSLEYLNSRTLIDYDVYDYREDDESGRLMKRAEFLKAACEKEGIEWLPDPEVISETMPCCGAVLETPKLDKTYPKKCRIRYLEDGQWKTKEVEFCPHELDEISPDGVMCKLCHKWFEKREPPKDYYTKAEVNEGLGEVFTQLHAIVSAIELLGEEPKRRITFLPPFPGTLGGWKEQVQQLRDRFVPRC